LLFQAFLGLFWLSLCYICISFIICIYIALYCCFCKLIFWVLVSTPSPPPPISLAGPPPHPVDCPSAPSCGRMWK
jgi:hypothetical protein